MSTYIQIHYNTCNLLMCSNGQQFNILLLFKCYHQHYLLYSNLQFIQCKWSVNEIGNKLNMKIKFNVNMKNNLPVSRNKFGILYVCKSFSIEIFFHCICIFPYDKIAIILHNSSNFEGNSINWRTCNYIRYGSWRRICSFILFHFSFLFFAFPFMQK